MTKKEYPLLGECCYSHTLANGMTLRVIPKKGFARQYAFVATNYGSIDTHFEINGQHIVTPDGVAHYLEHKMFDMPQGDAMQRFSAAGGNPNAFTSYGMTAYYFDCTENFEENLRILLELVSTPYFTEESVEKERGIISQEIRMYEDSADSCAYESLFSAMYDRHPIRVPVAGTVQSIQAITPQTLYDCHKAFYDPSNMILCVVGDVEPQRVAELADAILPPSAGRISTRDYGGAEPLDAEPRRTQRKMEIAMPKFNAGFRCAPPEQGQCAMQREIVGDLAAEILCGESSPLYTRLYEQGKIDSDFSAGYESVRGAAMLSLGGDSDTPDEVVEAILAEARRIADEGFDPALFARLKKSAIGRRTRDLDSFESICYRVCAYYFEGVEYFQFPQAYAEVTPQQVQAFIREVVRPERMAVSVIYPNQEERVC